VAAGEPGAVTFSTYNVLDLFAGNPDAGPDHYAKVVEAIRLLATDVLAVQEIRAPDLETGRLRLRQLAADTGLNCLASGRDGERVPALGYGPRGYHVALLWRDGIDPLPGTFASRSRDLWHALAWVTLEVGGLALRHASYHATPFGKKIRADQNEILVATLARPDTRRPTLVGADWNGDSADRVWDGRTGTWRLYEPGDPYAGVEWFEDLVYQCEWDYDERGVRRHRVDRSAGEVLWAGGLHDAAAVVGAPWQPTTGHHPSDPYGTRGIRRRIDAIRVTGEVVPALRSCRVTETALTREASDHLPVTAEYLPAKISV
jgi:endonuclease/exonuclease/phosphatase family metal-dependent hydrolase